MSINENKDFIVKLPNSNTNKNIKVGQKIVLSWDSKDCHALDAWYKWVENVDLDHKLL